MNILEVIEDRSGAWVAGLGWFLHETEFGVEILQPFNIGKCMPSIAKSQSIQTSVENAKNQIPGTSDSEGGTVRRNTRHSYPE